MCSNCRVSFRNGECPECGAPDPDANVESLAHEVKKGFAERHPPSTEHSVGPRNDSEQPLLPGVERFLR